MQVPAVHELGEFKGAIFMDAPESVLAARLTAMEPDGMHLGGFDNQFDTFCKHCLPVINKFEKQDMLTTIDSSGPLEEVYNSLDKAVKDVLK